MHRIEFIVGTDITKACERLVKTANEHGEAAGDFNGIELVAHRGSEPATLVAFYRTESQRQREAWYASEEYKAQQEAAAEADRQRRMAFEDAMRDAPEHPTWRDEAKYLDWRRKNEGDGYLRGAVGSTDGGPPFAGRAGGVVRSPHVEPRGYRGHHRFHVRVRRQHPVRVLDLR